MFYSPWSEAACCELSQNFIDCVFTFQSLSLDLKVRRRRAERALFGKLTERCHDSNPARSRATLTHDCVEASMYFARIPRRAQHVTSQWDFQKAPSQPDRLRHTFNHVFNINQVCIRFNDKLRRAFGISFIVYLYISLFFQVSLCQFQTPKLESDGTSALSARLNHALWFGTLKWWRNNYCKDYHCQRKSAGFHLLNGQVGWLW